MSEEQPKIIQIGNFSFPNFALIETPETRVKLLADLTGIIDVYKSLLKTTNPELTELNNSKEGDIFLYLMDLTGFKLHVNSSKITILNDLSRVETRIKVVRKNSLYTHFDVAYKGYDGKWVENIGKASYSEGKLDIGIYEYRLYSKELETETVRSVVMSISNHYEYDIQRKYFVGHYKTSPAIYLERSIPNDLLALANGSNGPTNMASNTFLSYDPVF